MDDDIGTIERLYARFNARDIEGVLEGLAEDVLWANGMEGGHVQGRQGVREYWTRQWSMIDPRVEPVRISRAGDQQILVEVRQTLRDLSGAPISDPATGLPCRMVRHIFTLRGGEVARFDIGD